MAVTTTDAVFAFLLAAAIAWLLVPFAERLAFRVGAIDQPKPRGLHDKPMPRLSGLAILVAVETAGWIWLPGDGESRSILLGAVAIAAIGVVDDVRGLPAFPKLLGQVAAATIPVLGGVRVDNLTLPFLGGFELDWLAYPLTVLGIVAVVNVINFIDGVDGLAAGVCTIAALTPAAIPLSLERTVAYLYAWTLVMAGLALALRFVPYSDNHGHFNVLWTAVMTAFLLLALAASVYLVYVLEILKLRRGRINPETGEFEAIELEPPPG